MDEYTLQALSSEGQKPDSTGFIGLWKIVVVSNLPYADMRRVGKIPKFLTHRLFPSARYNLYIYFSVVFYGYETITELLIIYTITYMQSNTLEDCKL